VNVFARLRGLNDRERGTAAAVFVVPDEHGGPAKRLCVDDVEAAVEAQLRSSASGPAGATVVPKTSTFDVDGVFGEDATQAEVFAEVGMPVLNAALAGFNGCVFAYGMTGSGKTYSLLHQDADKAGLLPRLVATLFARAQMDASNDYCVEAASLQVYNETVDDLLDADYQKGAGHNLNVLKGGIADKATWVACSSAHQLLELFAGARKNIVYAETKMNKSSSRSHALFQLRISKRAKGGAVGTVALLSVVDLAGSERVKRSGVQGAQFKEAVNINGSLLALGQVVSALAARKKHVPFRDSKLTRLLEGQLGGNCVTTLLTCCSPCADSTSETIAALNFAARAMRVELHATVNEAMPADFLAMSSSLAFVPTSDDAFDREALQRTFVLLEEQRALEALRSAEFRGEKSRLERLAVEAESKAQVNLDSQVRESQTRSAHTLAKAQTDFADALQAQSNSARVHLDEATKRQDAALETEREAAKAREAEASVRNFEKQRSLLEAKEREHRAVMESERRHHATATARELARQKQAVGHIQAELVAARAESALNKEALAALSRAHSLELAKATFKAHEALSRASAEAQAHENALLGLTSKHAAEMQDAKKRSTEDLAALEATLEAAHAAKQHEWEALTSASSTKQDLASTAALATSAQLAKMSAAAAAQAQSSAAAVEALEAHLAASQSCAKAKIQELETRTMALEAELHQYQNQLTALETELEVLRTAAAVKAAASVAEHSARLDAAHKYTLALRDQLTALEERANFEATKADNNVQKFDDLREKLTNDLNASRQVLIDIRKAHALELKGERLAHGALSAALEHKHTKQVRRERAVYSSARVMESEQRQDVEQRLADIVGSLSRREARAEDVEAIRNLQGNLRSTRQIVADSARESQQVRAILDHERQTDRIFGAASKRGSTDRTGALPDAHHQHQRVASLRSIAIKNPSPTSQRALATEAVTPPPRPLTSSARPRTSTQVKVSSTGHKLPRAAQFHDAAARAANDSAFQTLF